MFSARTPRGRLTVFGLVLIGAFLTASPAFARHHHHDDGSTSSKSGSGSGKSHSDSKPSATSSHSSSPHPPSSQPVSSHPSSVAAPVKAAPAPPFAAVSPLDMTRDAAASPMPGARAADAGRLNPAGQIFRMTGALVIVLLLLVGAAHLFRRSPWMAQVAGTSPAACDLSFQGTLKAAFSFLSPLAALAPSKRNGSTPRLKTLPAVPKNLPAAAPSVPLAPPASLDPGLLRLSGAQALPGGAASVYLIQIGTKGILLGTSASGPIQVLSEFEGLEAAVVASGTTPQTFASERVVSEAFIPEPSGSEPEPFALAEYSDAPSHFSPDFETLLREQDEEAAFDALMREETPSDPERGETLIVRSILERLNRTHDRLSRRLNDGTEPGEDRLSA